MRRSATGRVHARRTRCHTAAAHADEVDRNFKKLYARVLSPFREFAAVVAHSGSHTRGVQCGQHAVVPEVNPSDVNARSVVDRVPDGCKHRFEQGFKRLCREALVER